mgnify:CR=1 FL=1
MLFSLFERWIKPTASAPAGEPPKGLWAFYWHYLRQAKGPFIALFCAGCTVAFLDSLMPVFMGRIVTLVTTGAPSTLVADHGPELLRMALVVLLARPLALFTQNLITNQTINGNITNLIRWQSHWHVVRQSWTFFQNDFAGRIANRVLQTGPALRESLVLAFDAAWYIIVYGGSATLLLSSFDWHLALPIMVWFGCYAVMLRYFVPRLRSEEHTSELQSH